MRRWSRPLPAEPDRAILSNVWTTSTCYKQLEIERRDLHMQKLTRSMMQSLEKRLKTTIPWTGALHDDHTDKRHVHILAAIPRRLQKYELETFINEVTMLCRRERERRDLDLGKERKGWRDTLKPNEKYKSILLDTLRNTTTHQTTKSRRLQIPANREFQEYPLIQRRVRFSKIHSTCTCPRCHFPQSHDSHGAHGCVSCGFTLHKKRELSLQRKGRAWERSL